MRSRELEDEFKSQGLLFEYGEDEPGKIYTPHRHGWTKLVTLAGGIQLRLDEGSWFEQGPGDTCEIQSEQLHEAVVGEKGWIWLAAWRPEENDTFDVHEE